MVVGGLVSLALVLVPVGERLGVGYITGFSFGSAGHVLVEGLSVAAAAFTGLALLYEYEIDAEGSAATLLLGLAFLGSAALEAIHAGHSLGRPSPTDSYEGWLATGVYPALMLTVGSEVSRRWNAGQRRLGLPALAAVLILASWALPPFGDATCVGLVALAFILLQLRHRACSSTIDDALRWVLAPALAAQLAMVVATKDYGLGFGAAHMLRWIAYALPLGALAQHHAQARGQLARALRRAERAARSRRRTMQRLRERDEQLALALGAGSTTTWHYSVEHRRFEGDGQIRSLLGRGASGPRYAAKDELIELIHPEDRPFFRQALAAALSDGDPLALYVRVRGDHGDRHLSLRGSAVRRGDGSVGALIGVCQDVTAEKEAADERRRREARLISFLEALPVGVFVVEAGGPVFANRMAMELTPQVFDFRPGDAWSRVLDVRRAKTDERYPEKELPLVVAWKRGRGLADDLVVQRQGQDVPIAMWANREESASGTQFVIVVVEDVSDRKGLEAQLFHARKLEAVGRLSAGIAHEINTPTQFVSDNVQFLSDAIERLKALFQAWDDARPRLGPEARKTLERVERKCRLTYLRDEVPRAVAQSLEGLDRIATIVQAMKEFSHPGTGSERTLVDVNRCIDTTVTVARNEWKYVADVELNLEASLPPVSGLSNDLNQVFLNMIVNAAHAIRARVEAAPGEKGRIVLSTHAANDHVVVSVKDDGCGMPTSVVERIFDPFFTTKPVGQGTGQGLAIAHHVIVNKHGGRLRVESEPGQGSTFIIELPVAGAREALGEDAA